MSHIYRSSVRISPNDVDCFGYLRPSMLLRFAQEIAGQHCDLLGVNQQYLDEKGLFWAVIRNQLTVTKLPRAGQTVTLETWPMPTTRTAYPRATVGYDEDGNELFHTGSLWILMDRKSRAMVLPGKSGITVEGLRRENEPELPHSLSPVDGEFHRSRQVSFTDLDRNRHMNNARYLDWVDDVISADFHAGHRLRCATLCYLNEAKDGQNLDICWKTGVENSLFLDIRRSKNGGGHDRIFSAKLEFDTVVL